MRKFISSCARLRLRCFGRHGDQAGLLSFLGPHDILVIPPINQGVDLAVGVVTEEDPAFDTFAEKEIGSFREQLFLFVELFPFAFAFDK